MGVQERLRFVPAGWSESYEFTEADALHALDVIDALIEEKCGAREVHDPEKLPWDAIRSTLRKGVFGGRVTTAVDQKGLDDLVNYLFVQESFNVDYNLVKGVDDGPKLPEHTSKDACFQWIEGLQSYTPPTWIGLDNSAEVEREYRITQSVLKNVGLVSKKCEDDS